MKKTLLRHLLLTFIVIIGINIQSTAQQSFTFTTDTEGFEEGLRMTTEQAVSAGTDGVLLLTPNGTGKNPRFDYKGTVINADTYKKFTITLKNSSDATQYRFRVTGETSWYNITITTNDTDFKTYVLDISQDANAGKWVGDVLFETQIRKGGNEVIGFIEIDSMTFDTTLGTNEVLKNDSNVQLYPNPAINELKINTNKAIEKIEIFNVIGKKVLVNQGSNSLDISNLVKGVYLVKIFQIGNIVSSKKFVKN